MTRDLRKYTSQTTIRLIVGAVILVFIVGIGLIAWIYGPAAAVTAFLCLLGALVPVGLIVLILFGIDKIINKNNRD